MASESVMWQHLAQHAGPLLTMERIDAKRQEGVPDVSWCHGVSDTAGWLELKVVQVEFVPDRVRIPWKSPAQPLWLYRWARRGGRAGILLRDSTDSWYFWRAFGSASWHKAMLSVHLPDPTWCSIGALDADGLVRALTAKLATSW